MVRPGTTLTRAEEVIYLAGVTDGEGCFGYDSGSVRFTVTNTYRPMCERFRAAFGGQVRQLKGKDNEPGHRTQFSWRASGEEARAAMREMLPYLDEKAAQAKLLLLMWDLRKVPGSTNKLNAELKRLKRIDYGTDSTN